MPTPSDWRAFKSTPDGADALKVVSEWMKPPIPPAIPEKFRQLYEAFERLSFQRTPAQAWAEELSQSDLKLLDSLRIDPR